MPCRHHGFALAFALLVWPAGALGQVAKDQPAEMRAPLAGAAVFTITRVDFNGTIVLEPAETLPPPFRDNVGSFFAEGYYLLVTNDAQPGDSRHVLRVQVTDIAGSAFTLKVGPRSAAGVRVKDSARLVRPIPVTTAWLRALPDEIPFAGKPASAKTDVEPRVPRASSQSINNLKQLGLAMHNFESAHGAFPPAVIYGPDGKPWHSWRVLILPYLGAMDVYNAYDFSQPWDSPRNKAFIDKMPSVYRDPIGGDTKEPYTHYAALVGPRAAFRPEGTKQTAPNKPPIGAGGLRISRITDGTSNTMMIGSVEPERKIPWTKPEDIDVGPAFKVFDRAGGIAARYQSRGRSGGKAGPVLLCDASVHVIDASINPRKLEALLTCNGGEVITPDDFKSEALPPVSPGKTLKIRFDGTDVTAAIE
jgi:hypothetical protein